jgi:hypothetical protein
MQTLHESPGFFLARMKAHLSQAESHVLALIIDRSYGIEWIKLSKILTRAANFRRPGSRCRRRIIARWCCYRTSYCEIASNNDLMVGSIWSCRSNCAVCDFSDASHLETLLSTVMPLFT